MDDIALRNHKATLNIEARVGSIYYRVHLITDELKKIRLKLEEQSNGIIDGSSIGRDLTKAQFIIVCILMPTLILSLIYGAAILVCKITYYNSGREHLLLYDRRASWDHFCQWHRRMEKNDNDGTTVTYRVGLLKAKAKEVDQNVYHLPLLIRKTFEVKLENREGFDPALQDDSIDALNTLHTSLGVACVVGAFASISIYISTMFFSTTGLEWARLNAYFSFFTCVGTIVACLLVRCSIRETHLLALVAHMTEHIRLQIIKQLPTDDKVDKTTIVSGWHLIDSHEGDHNTGWYKRLGELRTTRLKGFVKSLEDATKSMYNLIGTYLLVILLVLVTAIWSKQTQYNRSLTSDQESIRNSLAATALFIWNASLTFTFSVALSSLQSWIILNEWMNDVYAQNAGEPHKDKWHIAKSILCLSVKILFTTGMSCCYCTSANKDAPSVSRGYNCPAPETKIQFNIKQSEDEPAN